MGPRFGLDAMVLRKIPTRAGTWTPDHAARTPTVPAPKLWGGTRKWFMWRYFPMRRLKLRTDCWAKTFSGQWQFSIKSSQNHPLLQLILSFHEFKRIHNRGETRVGYVV